MRRTRKKHSPHANHDRWLVSYADFITLLFAFFVVMYSTAQVDQRKAGQLATAIQAGFQQLGAYPTPSAKNPPLPVVVTSQHSPVTPLLRPEDVAGQAALQIEMEQALAPEISRDEVGVWPARDGLVISLREGGFFDSGSAGIKADSQPALSRMAAVLAERPYNLRIEGHTDNVRIHNAQYNSNWELSTARSTEMIRLLIVKYGFVAERLSASGYAEFHPIASNNAAAGRALNRRVDVVVLSDHGTASKADDASTSSPKP